MHRRATAAALSLGLGVAALFLLLGWMGRPTLAAEVEADVSWSAASRATEGRAAAASLPADATPIHYVAKTGTDSGDCSTPVSRSPSTVGLMIPLMYTTRPCLAASSVVG